MFTLKWTPFWCSFTPKNVVVRLELNAAVMSKMLHNFINEDTQLIFTKEYFIVDSEMVRAMIQKKLCGVNIFAAIHTGEIPTCTCPEDWT